MARAHETGGPAVGQVLAAIAANPAAQAMFEVLTKTNRFALISRVNAGK
ncbi:YdeI/OmpD-associated family protein [Kitasatospora sp. NPDC097605]